MRRGKDRRGSEAYLTLTDSNVVLLNTVVILGNKVCFTVCIFAMTIIINSEE